MDIAVLGPLEVNGTQNGLSPRDRVVLQVLALHPGTVLNPEVLADALWGDAPPESWPKIVQGCVVRLRKLLGVDAIETTPHGYRLVVHADVVDHPRFERLVTMARLRLAQGEPDRAAHLAEDALSLWRGGPLADLEEWEPGRAEAERLCALRLEAEDLAMEAALRTGRHQEVLATAMGRVSEAPLRERRWAFLALAQYQSAQQSDALATLRRARAMLSQELGLDPGPDLHALEQAILQQDPALVAQAALPVASPVCPYLGLMAYDVQDADVFFGREGDVAACLDRLDQAGLLVVVGPSGCGKSSLVRAGVAAALTRDGRRVTVITPGNRPVDALAAVGSRRTVLVVDQCEQAFSADVDPAQQSAFLDGLVQHSSTDVLVVALRADRLGGLSAHRAFARLVERGLYLLGGMKTEDLRSAIEGPAREAGLHLEPGLVDLLLRDVEGEPGALPLLSHALRQTWARREGSTLTVAGYAASGGVREAVAQSAEALYENVEPDQRPMLRDLMLRLVSPSPDGDPVPSRVPRRQIVTDEEHERLVEQLVRARLVSSDRDVVEIAHESLARAWPRLRAWLDDDVEGQRILRHLAVAAETWETMGRPDDELYRGVRLAKAAGWRSTAVPDLTPTEREFLDQSDRAAEVERQSAEQQVQRERRTNRRLRALLAGGAALLVAALVASTVALGSMNSAQRSSVRAERQAIAADARRVGAQALIAAEADTSLRLAAAGVALDDTVDTRSNLLAGLDRLPSLIRATDTEMGAIFTVSTSAHDGRLAVTFVESGVVLYDPVTLRELGRNSDGGAVAAEFSPDGELLAVSSNNFMAADEDTEAPLPIRLLDASGQPLAEQLGGIPEGYFAPTRASFSPGSGRWLAVVLRSEAEGKLAGVWDLDHRDTPVALIAVPDLARFAELSADGQTLYTVGDTLEARSVTTGQILRTVTPSELGASELVREVRLSPDGRVLAVNADDQIALLDADTLLVRARLVGESPLEWITFSRDGTRLAAKDDSLVVWDITRTEPTEIFRGDRWETEAVALGADARTLYSAGITGRLLAWDLEGERRFLAKRPVPPLIESAGFVSVSSDATMIAYWGAGTLQARDVASGRLGPLIRTEQRPGFFQDIAWRPDNGAMVGVYGDTVAQSWDPRTGSLLAEYDVAPDMVSTAVFTRDGTHLLVGTTGGRLHILDSASLRPVRPAIDPEVDIVLGIDPRPDQHSALVWGEGGERMVDYQTGRLGEPPPAAGTFSPDGQRIAVYNGSAVGLLDTDTLTWVSPLSTRHPYSNGYIAFSPDGSRFASAGQGKVGVWDGRTGAFIGAVAAEGAVGFQDSHTLVIAGFDGSVTTWDTRPETWLATACGMTDRQLNRDEWREFLPDREYKQVCT